MFVDRLKAMIFTHCIYPVCVSFSCCSRERFNKTQSAWENLRPIRLKDNLIFDSKIFFLSAVVIEASQYTGTIVANFLFLSRANIRLMNRILMGFVVRKLGLDSNAIILVQFT